MESTDWNSALETGDPLVDAQHRRIHELLSELEAAEDNRDAVMRMLTELVDYSSIHFATEEDLMRREGYPAEQLEPHLAEHRMLTEAVRSKVLQFRTGELSSTAPVIVFLGDWLTEHVHERDAHLVEFMRVRGASARELPGSQPDSGVSSADV